MCTQTSLLIAFAQMSASTLIMHKGFAFSPLSEHVQGKSKLVARPQYL